MYEKFYGFREKPFHIVPNPNFLYRSSKHENALTYLEYGIREGMGFILLTGEIGTGKTTLIRYILNQIEAEIEVAVIFNTNVTADQLLSLILQEFEIEPIDTDKAKNLDRLYHFLIRKYGKRQRVLLIIDEAQNLSDPVLEEVRMLSNLQADDNLLLQIMLVGQPELKAKLRRPGLAQLTQRIAVNYHLMPLSLEETEYYIASRLEKAGGNPKLFTPEAVEEVYRASNGTPRSINLLCDTALVYGFADETTVIDEHVIAQVLDDKGGILLPQPAEAPSEPETVEGGVYGPVDGSLQERFATLESRMAEMKVQIDWQLVELEKRADGFKQELVMQLAGQLDRERKKNDKLLMELGRLKEVMRRFQERLGEAQEGKVQAQGAASASSRKEKKKSWFSFW